MKLPSLLTLPLFLLVVSRAEPLVGIVGQNIVTFDSTQPGNSTFLATLAGLDIFELVHAIERKPVSGELFVLSNLTGPAGAYKLRRAYATGANEVVGPSFPISGSTKWALALQPDNATLRAVSNNGVNLRLDAATGARTTDTPLSYAAGDVAFGQVPRVGALVTLDNGNTYGLDIANWNVVTLDPSPSGTLRTVGSTGLTLTGSLSVNLDVSGSSGTVFLSVGNNAIPRTDLYTVNLGTGALSPLGQLGNSEIFLAMAAGAVSSGPPPVSGIDIAWSGGSGLTSLAANWSPAQLPTSLDTVRIHTGAPRVDSALNAAHLVSDRTLTFTNGTLNVHASLTNDGSLHLNGATSTFFGNLGIYGTGNIFLEGGTLASGNPADTLFNLGNNIQGSGFIPGIFVNQTNGVVTASDNGVLHVDRPVANFGAMNAAGGSLLAFSGGQPGTLDNSGGVIRANFGGAVFLAGPISGGRIVNNQNEPGELTGAVPGSPQQIRSPPAAGVFLGSFSAFPEDVEFNSSRAAVTLEGADINGSPAEFTLMRGMSLTLSGGLVNNGIIRAYGNVADGLAHIYLHSDVLVGGTGRIELGWAGRDGDEIIGFDHTLSLLPGQHLKGGGKVFTKVNNFDSTILADRASATEGTYPLRFYEPIGNYGLMRAQNNGAFDIYSSTLTQYDPAYSTVGHVESGSGGAVTFHGTEIIGGALVQSAGQSAFVYHYATLDGENAPGLELYGTHRAGGEAFDNLSVRGTVEFVDHALLEILGGSSLYAMGSPELIGSGRVRLGGDAVAAYVFVSSGEILHNEVTMAGIGAVTGDFGAQYWNRAGGRVQAHGGSLLLEITHLNDGVIEAGGRPTEGEQTVAGALVIGAFIDNLGTVQVNNLLSSVQLYGGTVAGGTLKTLGGGTAFIDQYGRLESLDLINDIRALGATWCDLAGTIHFRSGLFPDSYILAGGSSGEDTHVGINGTVILKGLGGVWLQDPDLVTGSARLVEGDTNPATVDKLILRDGARIRGAGLVDVDVHNESGTILADTPGGKLIFAEGRLVPQGITLTTYTSDEISTNPGLLQPNPLLGLIHAANGASVEIQAASLSGQQLLATGAGKVVFSGLAPVLGNLRMLLQDTSELVALQGLTMMEGVNVAVAGNETPGLPGTSSCDIPTLNLGTGPTFHVQGKPLLMNGGTLVAAGGGNLVAAGAGNAVEVAGNASLVAAGAGNIVAAGAGNLVAAGGGNLVAAGGGNLVAAGGGNLVAAGGGNLVAAGGGNLVAAGGGNIKVDAAGRLVAAGGGNIANTAKGNLVGAGGLNGLAGNPVAYGKLEVKDGGALDSDASHFFFAGGDRDTAMVDNQAGATMALKNQTCVTIPLGQFNNSGTLDDKNSIIIAALMRNQQLLNAQTAIFIMTGQWVTPTGQPLNALPGENTGMQNDATGVINMTDSFFGMQFVANGQANGGGGFFLAGANVTDPRNFVNDGTIILGSGICTNTFDMGFTQTNTGRLTVQLGGTATNGYDRLFINGPTVLGGVLQLVFTNNFAPTLGDTFDFLVCPDVIGNFDSVEIAGLPSGHNWQYHAVFTNGAYRVVSDSTVVLPIAAFRALHGLAADGSQDFANPSGDRIPNLLKYAFNLAANAGDLNTPNYRLLQSATDTAGLPSLVRTDNGVFQFVFVRRTEASMPGITYTPEISTSLDAGWVALVPDSAMVQPVGGVWERVILTLAAPFDPPHDTGGRVRVRVDRP